MVDLVGGYYSIGFALLVIGVLLSGTLLNALPNNILRAGGIGLVMYGGVLLVGFLTFVIANTPNLPSYAGAFPLLFVAIVLLIVIKMMSLQPILGKGTSASVHSSKDGKG